MNDYLSHFSSKFMIRQKISFRRRVFYGILSIVVLVSLYSWKCYQVKQKNPNDTTIPNIAQFKEGFELIFKPERLPGQSRKEVPAGHSMLYLDTMESLKRVFAGFGYAVVVACVLGVMMGCYPAVDAFFYPMLSFFKNIPGTAALGAFFVWVGTGFDLYITLIAFAVIPTMALGIYLATFNGISSKERDMAYTVGASHWEVIAEVVIPKMLPNILDAARLQIGPALVILICAEWGLADVGWGYRLRYESRFAHMNVVFLYIIFIGIIGFLTSYLLLTSRRLLCKWYEK